FSLTVDGETIRINLPPLTEEKRRDLVKLIKEKAEEARIAIRRHREEAWNKIQERFKEGKLREDDKFKGKDELQEVIDDYNERVEKMVKSKEEEIMKV
ncbi:MAG: ribosome recycling factor, partial [Spirochaetota bacterium]|nr:ribosome recycling factor [Spirochaetota bacterium]